MLSIMSPNSWAMSNLAFCEGGCSPFSSAHRSHTWISVSLLSWISVKCTVAGFFPQIWQTIEVLSLSCGQYAAFEGEDSVRGAGKPFVVGHDHECSMLLVRQR